MEAVQGKADVIYAKGFDTEGDQLDETLLREAVAAAKTAQVAVILPACQTPLNRRGSTVSI